MHGAPHFRPHLVAGITRAGGRGQRRRTGSRCPGRGGIGHGCSGFRGGSGCGCGCRLHRPRLSCGAPEPARALRRQRQPAVGIGGRVLRRGFKRGPADATSCTTWCRSWRHWASACHYGCTWRRGVRRPCHKNSSFLPELGKPDSRAAKVGVEGGTSERFSPTYVVNCFWTHKEDVPDHPRVFNRSSHERKHALLVQHAGTSDTA